VKTYQLGWYSQYHVNLPINGNFNWNGNLVGFAEKARATSSDKMIIRIITYTTDVYIHFNRMIGMNINTDEGGDQVLVTTRKTGVGDSEVSDLKSKLGANGVYTIPYFNGSPNSLEIRVNSITTTSAPARANISIKFGGTVTSPTPRPIFSSDLTPIFSPVEPPTRRPTLHRTRPPTAVPIKSTSKCNFNKKCEAGENCNSCPCDCNSQRNVYCCIGGKLCNKNQCNHSGRSCGK
jgi:hypothetical protein